MGKQRWVCVPEKMRMVSIPERKLASASSWGGLGVVDLDGMGVMDLWNPFSFGSFDSAEREQGLGQSRAILDQEGRGRSQRKAQNGKGVPVGTNTYFLTRRICLASCGRDDRGIWWKGGERG